MLEFTSANVKPGESVDEKGRHNVTITMTTLDAMAFTSGIAVLNQAIANPLNGMMTAEKMLAHIVHLSTADEFLNAVALAKNIAMKIMPAGEKPAERTDVKHLDLNELLGDVVDEDEEPPKT